MQHGEHGLLLHELPRLVEAVATVAASRVRVRAGHGEEGAAALAGRFAHLPNCED